jgi:hypothetical protein
MSGRRLSIFADESAAKGTYRHFLGGVALLTSDVADIEASLDDSARNFGFGKKEFHWCDLKKREIEGAIGFGFEFLKLVGPSFKLRLYCNKHQPENGKAEAKFKPDGISRIYGTFLRRSFRVVNDNGNGEYAGIDFNLDQFSWPAHQLDILREHMYSMALDCHARKGQLGFGLPDYKLNLADSNKSRIIQGVDLILGAWQYLLVHNSKCPESPKRHAAQEIAKLIRLHDWGRAFSRDKNIFPAAFDSPFGVWHSKYKTQK